MLAFGNEAVSRSLPSRNPPLSTSLTKIIFTPCLPASHSLSSARGRWGTFCNHMSGEWVGQYGAYTPWEGKPEPVWMDGKK